MQIHPSKHRRRMEVRLYRLLTVALVVALFVTGLPMLESEACAHALDRDLCVDSLGELADVEPLTGPGVPSPVSNNFELVGHSPLLSRGMNAAPAVHGNYVYVGSRTDGQPHHRNAGILVVDAADPAKPQVVHEITTPDAGAVGETSRELRVWPQQNLLIVLNFSCSEILHACINGNTTNNKSRITFFDISGANAAKPKLVATYTPSRIPHEFFLWVDPAKPADRALLFWTGPTTSTSQPNLVVTDISRARENVFSEVKWNASFAARKLPTGETEDRRLHSIGVSNDGTRTYLAFLGAGFLVMDTSQVAAGVANPQISLITQPRDRVSWSNPGAHTAVKLWGKDVALVTDEVYGDALDRITGQDHGCPWGWVRTLDISNEAAPQSLGEYRVEENTPKYCETTEGGHPLNTSFSSFSAHNPTLTPDIAFITWHSAGLEAVSLADPAKPTRLGKFKPSPLPLVGTEDPALSGGVDKVVMWSYPIISDGLIYVVDVRNGLYILRYTGPGAADVAAIDFLEGNSNLGDALRFEPVTTTP